MSRTSHSPERPDIRDPPIQRQHDRQPPKHHHTDHEHDESPGGESEVVVVELIEGKDGSDVDESGGVEEQIDDVGKVGLFGLFVEESTAKRSVVSEVEGKEEREGREKREGKNTYSQAKAVPQAKAARRSSLPRRVVTPAMGKNDRKEMSGLVREERRERRSSPIESMANEMY